MFMAAVPSQASRFFEARSPAYSWWKAHFFRRPNEQVVKWLPSRPTNLSNLFSDSIVEMEKPLLQVKKVKNGSKLEEAG
jgi:hypothetical protein